MPQQGKERLFVDIPLGGRNGPKILPTPILIPQEFSKNAMLKHEYLV
jgi:hypothetical protein